jgi:chromosome segregation protein
MRLKHLQLQGYKTFAAKTEFLFPTGITAIIGPNGSGKSNIIDAIRWVLGEQSYSTLRGKRTEDMIFSGSQSRSRAGMAEVILTLDNSDTWLPVEFSEVTISRRAFRDSQNEYRINGSRVRLRDISELLSQSGLSRRTYTVVGQGLVDSVLSLRAQDRRELFEEAAGIAHYLKKRDDALQRLEDTQHNLERVHDIISEIEPRLKRLERQAERTREFEELKTHLEQQLRIWYGYRWGQASAALNQAQKIANQRIEQHTARSRQLQELTRKIDGTRKAHGDLRRELGEWHHENSELHGRAEGLQRELAVLSERSRLLSIQRQQQAEEISDLDARIALQAERVSQARVKTLAAETRLAEREQAVEAAQSAFDTQMSQHDVLTKRREEAQEELVRLQTDIAERNMRRDVLEERIENLVAKKEEQRAQASRLEEELGKLSVQTARVAEKVSLIEKERGRVLHQTNILENRQQALANQLDEERAALQQLRETEADVTARLELLGQVRRDFSIYGQAVRSLLTRRDNGELESAVPGILGVLAQMIRVPDDDPHISATAVEIALGSYAGAIVVEDWNTAASVLEHLQSQDVPGRVILLALETRLDHDGSAPDLQPILDTAPISSWVQCDTELRPLVDRLLSRTFLVSDLDVARSKASLHPFSATFVTPRGDVLRSNAAIEGGNPADEMQPLAQEQEWTRVSARRVQIGARRETAAAAVATTNDALSAVQNDLAQSKTLLDKLDGRLETANAVQDKLTRQVDQTRQESAWLKEQLDQSDEDQDLLRRRQNDLREEITQVSQDRSVIERNLQRIGNAIEALPVSRVRDDLTTAQMNLAIARQDLNGHQTIQSELESGLSQVTKERETRKERLSVLISEERAVNDQTAQLMDAHEAINIQLDALAAEIKPAEERLENLETELAQLEARERSESARLREFESHLASVRLDVQRREDVIAQLQGRIEEDLGLVELELGPTISGQSPLPLHPLVSKLPVVRRLPNGVEDEIKRLRAQLRRLGAINPNAPEEFREAEERYGFLSGQSSDLVAASDSLRKVIAEMDALIEHAFRQTFDAVATQFSETFTDLFGGGQARLELTDPDDLTQTGVEIIAQPPRKRLQALASLSGGERALTAVALIFSILRVSPTPFCILDEVDAMLDEANIGRFRNLLESLTESTQIVIITHNRGTISSADTVYGISMGADSVSQVYSVRMKGETIQEP